LHGRFDRSAGLERRGRLPPLWETGGKREGKDRADTGVVRPGGLLYNVGCMNEYELKALKAGCFFPKSARLDEGFELLAPEMPLSQELIAALKRWFYRKILSDGNPQDAYKPASVEAEAQVNLSDKAKINKAQFYIDGLVSWVTTVFDRAQRGEKISFNDVAEKVKELYNRIKEEKRYLLLVRNYSIGINDVEFYASHCVRTAITAIIMGCFLKFSIHRLIELGVAALVHEIGMMRLPYEIYKNKAEITKEEYEMICHHTVYGFELLKSYDFPLAVCAVALEHHERGSGTGYPKKIPKSQISLYSKIIAVACTYSALIEDRPYREANIPYAGITQMLRNEGGLYDEGIVKALVYSFSLYPIGQYVLLSDGSKGQVVDTNPDDPRHPVVQVLGVLTPDKKNKIVETSQDGIYIAKPLEASEVDLT